MLAQGLGTFHRSPTSNNVSTCSLLVLCFCLLVFCFSTSLRSLFYYLSTLSPNIKIQNNFLHQAQNPKYTNASVCLSNRWLWWRVKSTGRKEKPAPTAWIGKPRWKWSATPTPWKQVRGGIVCALFVNNRTFFDLKFLFFLFFPKKRLVGWNKTVHEINHEQLHTTFGHAWRHGR